MDTVLTEVYKDWLIEVFDQPACAPDRYSWQASIGSITGIGPFMSDTIVGCVLEAREHIDFYEPS